MNPATHVLSVGPCPRGYVPLQWNQTGPPGVPVPATATMSGPLTGVPIPGVQVPTPSNWALGDVTVTATVTLQYGVPVSNCPGSPTDCYLYTGTIQGSRGFFTTTPGAFSPDSGTTNTGAYLSATVINGIVHGFFHGSATVVFYATSNAPSAWTAKTAVKHLDIGDEAVALLEQFFPEGTQFAGAGGPLTPPSITDYNWIFHAPATCETWNYANTGTSGDIGGINKCASLRPDAIR